MSGDWPALSPLVDAPASGRVHRAERRVRLGDVGADGDLRLDAAVRYLQDVAADDVWDIGMGDAAAWVVRRTTVAVARRPRFGDRVGLATWCAGTGAAWTERRTSITGPSGAAAEAATLWVALDPGSLRPRPLPPSFFAIYGEATAGRSVKARLRFPARPAAAPARTWPLRRSDFDVFGHVNNAVVWQAVEEEAAGRPIRAAEVEYRAPIQSANPLALVPHPFPGGFGLWVTDPARPAEAAVVARVELGGR